MFLIKRRPPGSLQLVLGRYYASRPLKFIFNVGVALAGIGDARFEVGVARATPKVYKSPPLEVILAIIDLWREMSG